MSGSAAAANRWCHRCGGELPPEGTEDSLYCPHCAAPQLFLPDYLRLVTPEMEEQIARTTGMVPPPRPRLVDWQAALRSAGLVAVVAAVLMSFGMLVDALQAMGTLWMLASGFAATWIYGRLRPGLRMDARVGVRIGVTSGLATVSLVAVVLTAGALVARLLLHRSTQLDDWISKGLAVFVAMLNSQPGNPLLDPQGIALLNSPEGRVGYILLNAASNTVFLVLLAAATGALAGTLAGRRARVGRAL